jgi:hypothetical protein
MKWLAAMPFHRFLRRLHNRLRRNSHDAAHGVPVHDCSWGPLDLSRGVFPDPNKIRVVGWSERLNRPIITIDVDNNNEMFEVDGHMYRVTDEDI